MKQKNFFCALFTALAVLFLCACDSPEEKVVENFYDALYEGDFEAAKKYCSYDAAKALDHLAAIAKENPEAMEQWRNDMAFEKEFFRFLTAEEIAYQEEQDEKQKKANEKSMEKQRQQLSKEEFEAIQNAENAEQAELEDTKIVYTRWSKGLVYKHYLKKIGYRWVIVKIENGYPLPERNTKGN